MTPEQCETYDREGLICIRGAVDSLRVAAMREVLWDALARKHAMRRNEPDTWTVARPSGLASVLSRNAFAGMASEDVTKALDALLPGGWSRPARWGVALVTFPDRDSGTSWDVPSSQWHLDCPAQAEDPNIARIFLLLESVEPQGGGTLVVKGSHRLFRQLAQRAARSLRSAEACLRVRAEHPWFAALSSPERVQQRIERFMAHDTRLGDVDVRVVEMTGEPGDVYFMHPSMLHAPSANKRNRPRLMLTQWIEA